jgi:hypothetical protein
VVVYVFRSEFAEWKARAVRIALTLGFVLLLTVTAMNDLVSALSRYPDFLLERWLPVRLNVIGSEAPLVEAEPVAVAAEAPEAPVIVGGVTRASRSSVEGRVDAWEMALERWQERPILGHGTLVGELQEGWWYSSLVQALYDTGLVGFFALLWIHAGAVVLPARKWLRTRRGQMSANLLGFAAGNAVLGFSSQFSNFLFVGFPWVFLGLSMAAVQGSRAPRVRPTAHDSDVPAHPRATQQLKMVHLDSGISTTSRDYASGDAADELMSDLNRRERTRDSFGFLPRDGG